LFGTRYTRVFESTDMLLAHIARSVRARTEKVAVGVSVRFECWAMCLVCSYDYRVELSRLGFHCACTWQRRGECSHDV
jgi:hypothetical protein